MHLAMVSGKSIGLRLPFCCRDSRKLLSTLARVVDIDVVTLFPSDISTRNPKVFTTRRVRVRCFPPLL